MTDLQAGVERVDRLREHKRYGVEPEGPGLGMILQRIGNRDMTIAVSNPQNNSAIDKL